MWHSSLWMLAITATAAHWLLRETEGTACFSPQPFSYSRPPFGALEHPCSHTESDSIAGVFILPSSSQGNRSKPMVLMVLDLNGFRPENLLQPTWRFSSSLFQWQMRMSKDFGGSCVYEEIWICKYSNWQKKLDSNWPLTQSVISLKKQKDMLVYLFCRYFFFFVSFAAAKLMECYSPWFYLVSIPIALRSDCTL